MPFREVLKFYAETDPWTGFKPFGKYKELQGNSVLLGLKGRKTNKGIKLDYRKPVYLDFGVESNNPLNLLIMGRKGAGKTTLASTIAFQLWKYFGCHVFMIDPKATLGAFKHPQRDPYLVSMLEEAGVKPEGMPLKVITPKLFKGSPKYKYTDIFYSITMENFDMIEEFSFKRQLMASVLGIEEQEPSMRKMDEILATAPKSFEEFEIELKKLNSQSRTMEKVKIFDINFYRRLSEGVIGDSDKVDIVSMMKECPVGLQCSLSPDDKINMAYVAFALYSIKSGMEAGKFNGKVVFLIDEADILAPSSVRNPPSKIPMEHMSTKWRSDGAIPINLVQDPSKFSGTILQQVDAVLTPAIGNNTGEEHFIRSKFPGVDTVQLMMLHYGKPDEYPKEWALITSDQEVETFYPLPSPFLTDVKAL